VPSDPAIDRNARGHDGNRVRDPRLGRVAIIFAALIFAAFAVLPNFNDSFTRNRLELHFLLFLFVFGTIISIIAVIRRSSAKLAWASFVFCLLCWLWYLLTLMTQNFG
jgi:hypothetical protein